MQFSPLILAALTASAALGIAAPTQAKTPDSSVEPAFGAVNTLENGESSSRAVAVPAPENSALGSSSSSSNLLGQSAPTSRSTIAVEPPSPSNQSVNFLEKMLAQAEPQNSRSSAPTPENRLGQSVPGAPTVIPGAPVPDQTGQTVQPGTAPTQPSQPVQSAPVPGTGQLDGAPGVPSPATRPARPADSTAPGVAPTTLPGLPTPAPSETAQPEPRVLVSEVAVSGADGALLEEVYRVIGTRPGRTTTRSQLQQDINAIFATGFFSNVQALPEDTPLGVRVTFAVQPNPPLRSVRLRGNALESLDYKGKRVPVQTVVDDIFGKQYGQTANLRSLQTGIQQLNQTYQNNGYVLAQVVSSPEISPDGVATLDIAEGQIESISIRFLNKNGEAVDAKGNPIRGRTRPFIITREFQSKPGDVFNQNQIQRDLQRAFALGIFQDLKIALNPGQDPRKVDIVVDVTERRTGSLAASVGVSSTSGLFGAVSLQEQNLGGNNQRLNAEVQVGQRDILFDLSFTDPWIATDPNRTSYTVNVFGRDSISLVFDGGPDPVYLPNGDIPRIIRFGGGITFSRPLNNGWRASLGFQYQNISVRNSNLNVSPRDEFGNLLSFNRSGTDNVATVQFSASQDLRNDPVQTTRGSVLRFSTEQAIGIDSIFYNRLRASYSYYIPVRLIAFTKGCKKKNPTPGECPQTLAFNVQGGTILGDFPPYEAFSLGGTDSVRGYDSGYLGSGKSYLQGTLEYRFPVFSIISGALFVDAGTDLGTASEIPGNPAGIRNKPGSGYGYGVGIRVQSPLGQIRVDYAINDSGESRIHFGIGERF